MCVINAAYNELQDVSNNQVKSDITNSRVILVVVLLNMLFL